MRKLFILLALVAFSAAFAEPFVWPNVWSRDAGSAVSGGTLRQSSISNPRTFNPFVSAEQNDVIDISDTRGAILITRGPDSDEWIPYAASSFTVSPDGTVIDMVLRDGIRWSDGTPVTVADYMFRYTAETDPEVESNAYDGYFINDEKIILEITGDNSLRWTFPAPDRTAFSVAALVPAPDHILGEAYRAGGAEALKAAWGTEVDPKETVWTGPWVPTSLSPDERLIMERNPYFGEWNVDEAGTALPYIDTIEISIVESVDAALNLYIAGNLGSL
ncbi:MAG: ABC transporter substrate-binding protein [Deinococcales bacterium]